MTSVVTRNLRIICIAAQTFPVRASSVRSASLLTNNAKSLKIDTSKPTIPKSISSPKRVIDRHRQANTEDDGSWSVIAYNLSEELKIEEAQKLLENFGDYRMITLPSDVQDEAVMMRSRTGPSQLDSRSQRPLSDIFMFREGSVVFWGVPYNQQRRILYGIASLKINPNAKELVQEEKEHINYKLTEHGEKSRLNGDVIQILTSQDEQSQLMDQFAFSHAVALSVKLGIWEMILDEYIDSVEWITEDMKLGKNIRLTRDQVFRKTGEILCLKHGINLSSDLLDLPDIYWDRKNQEVMFLSLFAYLNIKRRTNVINEKLNNCCELMNLLSSHMNDRHHIRLEWMIIALITVESGLPQFVIQFKYAACGHLPIEKIAAGLHALDSLVLLNQTELIPDLLFYIERPLIPGDGPVEISAMPVARKQILRLYKDCLVYINSLKYSDKNYLRDKVRQEFRQVADEDYVLDADYYYEKGRAFLERRRFV